MSATQVTKPCWVPSWNGDSRTDAQASGGPHYAGPDDMPGFGEGNGLTAFHDNCGGVVVFGLGEFCTACEDENPQWTQHRVVPRRLGDCWTVTCDGPCGDELEDDETGGLHFSTRAAAEQTASDGYNWRFLPDGRAFCEEDAPPDAYLVGQIKGQMTLEEASGQ